MRRFTLTISTISLALLLLISQQSFSDTENNIRQNKSNKTSTFYGIDISHFQGDLMQALNNNSNFTFIIAKATQGVDTIDSDFKSNWESIKNKGYIRGAYHFYMIDDDPEKQANFFASQINDIQKDDIPPIVDIEPLSLSGKSISPDSLQKKLLAFLNTLETKLNRKPMIYTGYNFAQKYLNNTLFSQYDLWLAEYSGSSKPKVPDTWSKKGFKIWQKSDSYHVNSIETDFDEYIGSKEGLTGL